MRKSANTAVQNAECANSAQCRGYKHHFDECVERVTAHHENPEKGHKEENCVEECECFLSHTREGGDADKPRPSLPPPALRYCLCGAEAVQTAKVGQYPGTRIWTSKGQTIKKTPSASIEGSRLSLASACIEVSEHQDVACDNGRSLVIVPYILLDPGQPVQQQSTRYTSCDSAFVFCIFRNLRNCKVYASPVNCHSVRHGAPQPLHLSSDLLPIVSALYISSVQTTPNTTVKA